MVRWGVSDAPDAVVVIWCFGLSKRVREGDVSVRVLTGLFPLQHAAVALTGVNEW